MKYHPDKSVILILRFLTTRETVLEGQFDWGGRLLKCNGGVQRSPQRE